MQLHQLRPIHKQRKSKRICRGGAHGFHGGAGNEGQKSRAGMRLQPLIREMIKKYPKLRGYKFKSRSKFAVLNLSALEKSFEAGEIITPQALVKRRIIRKINGKIPSIKILGGGKVSKKLVLEGRMELSKSAKDALEKAGGTVKITVRQT
jgi:large subunit ribosomal protein L15